ncbi:MAG: histidine phosphatase family protein [Lachnospiraceae bacterium]|nr:histidine phosphatase family protein [Lachnospiraceae bacterium]
MRVVFLRHGRTEYNELRRLQGNIDIPLSDTGRAQAMKAREEFAERGYVFTHIYTSPLSRAVETAVIATGKPEEALIKDERLLEYHFGEYDGRPFDEVKEELDKLFNDPMNADVGCGVETLPHLLQRVGDFLDEIKEKHDAHDEILVSVHGGIIQGMRCALGLLDPNEFWNRIIGNCGFIELTLRDGEYKVTDVVFKRAY